MTHPRKVIRHSVVDAIKAANTIAGDRVWAGEQPPIDVLQVLKEEGPVILVYTRRDRLGRDGFSATGVGPVRRECDLCIEILAAGNFAVDDKLDDVAEQVEPLIDNFDVPGQPSTEIRHHETHIETTDQFEKPVAGAFIMYEAAYWSAGRPDPDAEALVCPTDIGFRANGGPRERIDVDCDCDHP